MNDSHGKILEGFKKDFEAYKDLLKYASNNNKKDCVKIIYEGLESLHMKVVELSHKLDPNDTAAFKELLSFRNSIIDIIGYKF